MSTGDGCNCIMPKWPARKKRDCSKKRKEESKKKNPVQQLVDKGWTREHTTVQDKVFLAGKVVYDPHLFVKLKFLVVGDCVVVGELECEGNFTLCGTLSCWNHPAKVKNMIVMGYGVVEGDVIVSSGAYIKGQCVINGRLTVTGNLRVCGSLQCKHLNVTGVVEKFGDGTKIEAESEMVINGEDEQLNERLAVVANYVYGPQK